MRGCAGGAGDIGVVPVVLTQPVGDSTNADAKTTDTTPLIAVYQLVSFMVFPSEQSCSYKGLRSGQVSIVRTVGGTPS